MIDDAHCLLDLRENGDSLKESEKTKTKQLHYEANKSDLKGKREKKTIIENFQIQDVDREQKERRYDVRVSEKRGERSTSACRPAAV